MFYLPEVHMRSHYLCSVDDDELTECLHTVKFRSAVACDELIHEVACSIMSERDWQVPETPQEAMDLYLKLRESIMALIQ